MSDCMSEKLSTEWRFFFFEKILNQDATLTAREAICINKLFSTVKDESQASHLITRIKEKEYEKKLIKTMADMRSTVFSNVANGLAWLYYSQNKCTVVEAGKNANSENFFAWQPMGSTVEKYKKYASNPKFSNWFDWMYSSKLNSYTVHLEGDGRFRVHVISRNPYTTASYHENIYLKPFETVSVYFASKNKYVNIDDNTVVMPGVLLAWMIDQSERESNQMLFEIGLIAATFYSGGSAVISSTGRFGRTIHTILLVKSLTDLTVKVADEELKGLLTDKVIDSYKRLSNIIDCALIFKQFADKEINQEVLMLSKAWDEVSVSNKEVLEQRYPDVISLIQKHINKLR